MAFFSNKKKSEYYGSDRYISIVDISSENFSTPQQPSPMSEPSNFSHHAIFQSVLSYIMKHDSSTTDAHIKPMIEFIEKMMISFL